MGIPSYFSHIVKQHRRIVKKYDKNNLKIHNLYMDSNSIIYDAVREIEKTCDIKGCYDNKFESALIKLVCKKLEEFIKLIDPQSRVYIAFDGVAPVAKLDQQRNRRYKTGFQARILSKFDDDVDAKKSQYSWNTAAITPGTHFMKKLGNAVKKRFANPNEFGLDKLVVSCSGDVGEGEHKIFDYIRKNQTHHKNTTTVIYGLDADLIMLTLNHLHIAPNILLYRETPHFISSIDRTLSPNESYLLDIPLFGKVLARDLNDNKEPDTIQKRNRVFDYIFLCFFLGNDFLPHFPALNIRTTGIDRLLSAYRNVVGTTNENLVNGTSVVWKNVRKLIQELSKYEETMMKEEYVIRDKQSKGVLRRKMETEEAFMSIPLLDRKQELYINPYENGWEERYYSTLFDIRIDDIRRKQISMNYLEGLEWTLKYYTEGCVDWHWGYDYNYPPLIVDLVKYIPSFDTTMIKINDLPPVSPLVQLSYVLPGASLSLLPKNIETALRSNYSECYREEHEFCWAYCRYFWEGHALMPSFDIDALERLIKATQNHY